MFMFACVWKAEVPLEFDFSGASYLGFSDSLPFGLQLTVYVDLAAEPNTRICLFLLGYKHALSYPAVLCGFSDQT